MILSEWLLEHPEVSVSAPGCVLTDTDWRTLHGRGLVVERSISGVAAEIVVQEASLDVHLATATKLTDEGEKEVVFVAGQSVVICPGEVMIIETQERFKIPDDARGLVAPKGKVTNLGLTIPTTYVDPGFTKPLFLAVANAGPRAVELESGSAIAKVELQRLDAPVADPWDGQSPAWSVFAKGLFADVECEPPQYLHAAVERLRQELVAAAARDAPAPSATADTQLAASIRVLQVWVLSLTSLLVTAVAGLVIVLAFRSDFGQGVLASILAACIVSAVVWFARGPLQQMLSGQPHP
jgi:deoxycytidine triphosphate deaminase